MRRLPWLLPAMFLIASPGRELVAVTLQLGQRDIDRALALGAASSSLRARFHARYITPVDDPTVEQIEVITEFRRYVLAAEEQISLGHHMSGQATDGVLNALRPWRGRLSITARLRFHPQNTFATLPPYECLLGDPAIAPLDLVRTSIQGLLSGRRGDSYAPLMGARVEAVFLAASVGQTTQPVHVALEGREVKRVLIDFAKLE